MTGSRKNYNDSTAAKLIAKANMADGQLNIDKAACTANMFYFFLNAAKSCLYPFLALYLGRIGLSATQVGIAFGIKSVIGMVVIPQWTSCTQYLKKKRFLMIFSILILIASYLTLSVLPPAVESICSDKPVSQMVKTPASNKTQSTTIPKTTSLETAAWNDSINKFTTENLSTMGQDVNLTEEDIRNFRELGLSRNQVESMSLNDLIQFLQKSLNASEPSSHVFLSTLMPHARHNSSQTNNRPERDVMYDYMNRFSQSVADWQGQTNNKQYQTFMFVMLVMISIALFASPLEKLADDCWFEYLDVLDKLDKYGHHRAWGLVGAAITPVVVTYLVASSDCLLGGVVYHMIIHFYGFILLLVGVFCLAGYFPISQNKVTTKRANMFRGFRLLCGDVHAFCLTISIFLYSIVYAGLFNFLFWRMAEIDPSEMPMGVCVAVGAVSEVIVYAVYTSCGNCSHPASYCGAILISFVALALRFIFYSFMFDPWFVVIGEAFHGISNMLMQMVIENYPDFRLSMYTPDRSVLSAMLALCQGLGQGVGCVLAGTVYDVMGAPFLFQCSAGLCVLWGITFVILTLCCGRKETIVYTKLLAIDDPDGGEGSDSLCAEDWLDVALEKNE